MDPSNTQWRKSSYTTPNGGNCVELASLPNNVTWRKSSQSGENGGNCVELAGLADVVAVRDSKDPDGEVLMLRREALRTALQAAAIENA
ncbi:DUF397 domain-containing protein [Spirillospora sp. CA-128828]|uniref:DUF397 domain-containing protein n=1 Tax=Spirillospora sp. CA-128828 TaxID=3240033 RepID=UPI003D900D21